MTLIITNGYWTVHGEIKPGTLVSCPLGLGYITFVDNDRFSVHLTSDECVIFNSWRVNGRFVVGSSVTHYKYGHGIIEEINLDDKTASILFNSCGVRELKFTYILEAQQVLPDSGEQKAITAYPILELIKLLQQVPGEQYHGEILNRLFQLQADDPCIKAERVHQFLRKLHSQLMHGQIAEEPIILAHICWLAQNEDYELAHALIDRLPSNYRSAFISLIKYLQFVKSSPINLSGTTEYSSLSEKDLFLGACYYGGGASTSSPVANQVQSILEHQENWDYRSLENALTRSGDPRLLPDFKVRGLQPRIAELAFREIYSRLHGDDAGSGLCDLNLACIDSHPPPWKLDLRQQLPGADWMNTNGQLYDVKCNLFYSSKQPKEGLRGYVIKRSELQQHSFPGFVFTRTNNKSCSWTYIGDYQPSVMTSDAGTRVLPFCFRLPDCARHIEPLKETISYVENYFLNQPAIYYGWKLATGLSSGSPQIEPDSSKSLLFEFIDRCITETADSLFEYAVWKTLTETTFDAYGKHSTAIIKEYLDDVKQIISSQAFPVHFPRINGIPLLNRWIDDVLIRLIDNYSDIRCTRCDSQVAGSHRIQLTITRMTTGGAIEGQVVCTNCNTLKDATLLTHCYKCRHYPLIIGKNSLCECGGLICTFTDELGHQCKSCRRNCAKINDDAAVG